MTTAVEVQGFCDNRFSRVRVAFADNFSKHGEVGASLAVMVDGQMVVDIWGGARDVAGTRPWERDTIANLFSTTKGMTAICAHRLAEQGLLDFDAPVATYWPEFAQAGKEALPVRYLLSHRAGLPALHELLPAGTGYGNWDLFVEKLAATEPWWEPGTKHGYHAITFGHLVGELIRRISGMSVGTYFRKEIAEPLRLDFHIGMGPEQDSRTAEIISASLVPPDPNHPLAKAFADPDSMTSHAFMLSLDNTLDPAFVNSREWRAAEIPAANGHGNARALARIYGALAHGGELDGVPVLKPETIEAARVEQSYGDDAVLFLPTRFGLGFMLDLPEFQLTPSGSLFGHPGAGGSIGFADPVEKVGFGYAMNNMIMTLDLIDPRWKPMIDAVYASI